MTKYASFAHLEQHEAQGRDFEIRSTDRPGSRVLVIAPHGGMIEVGTSEIALLIAGDEHSIFCFEGTKPYDFNRDLHITSHRFDHPRCLAMAACREIVLAIHGCKGHTQIFLGGLDAGLNERLAAELVVRGYEVIREGHRYPGRHPHNVCNRGLRRQGVQVEITYDLRSDPHHHREIAAAARLAIAHELAHGPACRSILRSASDDLR